MTQSKHMHTLAQLDLLFLRNGGKWERSWKLVIFVPMYVSVWPRQINERNELKALFF